MRVLGVVLLFAIIVVFAMMTQPAHLTYRSGTWPVVDSYDHGCLGDEPGMKSCWRDTAFRWRLSVGGVRLQTTLAFDRDDIIRLDGIVELASARCPESRVEWVLTADGQKAGGVLTADGRSAKVSFTGRPLSEVRVSLGRTDSASCASEFRLTEPQLEFPDFSLPV